MRIRYLSALVSVLSLLPESAFASVLAIDYGADWIKASLVGPGVPFDVLLNKDSKRKVQSSVAWKNDDRLFGTDAFNLVRLDFLHIVRPCVDYLLTLSSQGLPFSVRFVLFRQVSPGSTIRLCRSLILHYHLNRSSRRHVTQNGSSTAQRRNRMVR
jgi:hypothetical protein